MNDKDHIKQLKTQIASLKTQLAASRKQNRNSALPTIFEGLEYLTTAIAVFDVNINYIYANANWRTNHNLSEDTTSWLGKSLYALEPNMKIVWQSIHRRCLLGAHEQAQEDPMARGHDSVEWLNWSIYPWHDKNGNIAGLVMNTIDVTSYVIAKEDSKVFRKLAEASSDGIVMNNLNNDIVYANPAYKELLNIPSEENIINKSLTEYVSEVEQLSNVNQTTLLQGEWTGVVEHKRASGESFTAHVTSFAICDQLGALTQRVSIHKDLSALKKVESALQEKEIQLEKAQQIAKIGSWVLELDTKKFILSQKAREIFELPANKMEINLSTLMDLVSPTEIPQVLQLIQEAVETHKSHDLEIGIFTAKGKSLWTRFISEPIIENNEVVKLNGTIQDITKLRRAQEQLQYHNSRLETLNMLSQELNHVKNLGQLLSSIIKNSNINKPFYATLSRPIFEDNKITGLRIIAAETTTGEILNEIQDIILPIDTQKSYLAKSLVNSKNETHFCQNINEDKHLLDEEVEYFLQSQIQAYAGSMFFEKDKAVALLFFNFATPYIFSREEKDYITALPLIATPIISKLELLETLENTVEERTQALKEQLDETLIFKTLIESTPDMVGYADLEGNIQYLNPAARDFFGQDIQKSFDTMHPDELDNIGHYMDTELYTTGALELETLIRKSTGEYVPARQIISILNDAQGKPIAHGTIGHDISQSKKLEKNLKESNAILTKFNQLSQSLNQANSIEEMVQIVSSFAFENEAHHAIFIDLENKDIFKTKMSDISKIIVTAKGKIYNDISIDSSPYNLASFNIYSSDYIHHWLLNTENNILVIKNIETNNGIDEHLRSILLHHNIHTQVLIPLLQNKQWVGTLILNWQVPHDFSKTELNYYETLQSLMPPVFLNLNLVDNLEHMVAERNQALKFANQHLEAVNQINNKLQRTNNLAEVLDVFIAPFGNNVYASIAYPIPNEDGEILAIEFRGNLQDARASNLSKGDITQLKDFPSLGKRFINNNKVIYITDAQNDPRVDSNSKAFLIKNGIFSEANLTLKQNERDIAFVSLLWKEKHDFSLEEKKLIESLPAILSPVIAKLQALDNIKQTNDHLSLMNNVGRKLLTAESAKDILNTILEPLSKDTNALLFTVERDKHNTPIGIQLVCDAIKGNNYKFTPRLSYLPLDEYYTLKDWIFNANQTIFINDVLNEVDNLSDNLMLFYKAYKVKSISYINLAKGNETFACLTLFRPHTNDFSLDEKRYLNNISNILSPTLANYQARTNLAKNNEHLALLNSVGYELRNTETLDEISEAALIPFKDDVSCFIFNVKSSNNWDDNRIVASSSSHKGNKPIAMDIEHQLRFSEYPELEQLLTVNKNEKLSLWQDSEEEIDPSKCKVLALHRSLGIKSSASIGLWQRNDFIGLLVFFWPTQYKPNKMELQYLESLPSLIAPVVANFQSLASLEHSNQRLALINKISNLIRTFKTAEEIVNVALEPLDHIKEKFSRGLFYIQENQNKEIDKMMSAYSQSRKGVKNYIPKGKFFKNRTPESTKLWQARPEKTLIIEDITKNPTFQKEYATYQKTMAMVVIPLYQSNSWVGVLFLSFNEPYKFSYDECAYLDSLPALLTPSLANCKTLENLESTIEKRSKELNESRKLLSSTIDNASSLILVKDLEGKFLLVNKVYADFLGLTPEELIGKSSYLPSSNKNIQVNNQDTQESIKHMQMIKQKDLEILETGIPVTFEEKFTFNNKGESRIFLTTKFPIYNDKGEAYALGVIANEITEQRKKDEEVNLYRNQIAKAETELKITQRIQELLLPAASELENIQELDIASYMQPAEQVGGDYYDILKVGNHIKMGIGDVTGHGLESGLLMLMTQAAARTLLNDEDEEPIHIMTVLNETVFDNLQRMNVDKSLTLSLLDYHKGEVRLSGQHEHVLVIRQNGKIETIDTIDLGLPLGLEKDVGHFFTEKTFDLAHGEGVILYTDGITEAENDKGEQFGLERLIQVVEEYWQAPAQKIADAITEAVYNHINEFEIYDDITLVVFKRNHDHILPPQSITIPKIHTKTS